MNRIFKRISSRMFAHLSILFSFLGDLVLVAYIYHKASNSYNTFYSLMQETLKQAQIDILMVDQEFVHQQFQLLIQALWIMLLLMVLFHAFNYIFYYRGKKISRNYLFIVSWVAGPGLMLSGLLQILSSPFWAILLVGQGALYLFVALGLLHFRPQKT